MPERLPRQPEQRPRRSPGAGRSPPRRGRRPPRRRQRACGPQRRPVAGCAAARRHRHAGGHRPAVDRACKRLGARLPGLEQHPHRQHDRRQPQQLRLRRQQQLRRDGVRPQRSCRRPPLCRPRRERHREKPRLLATPRADRLREGSGGRQHQRRRQQIIGLEAGNSTMNAPWSSTQRFADAPRDLFSAFVSDDATAEVLKNTVLDMGWQPERIHRGGLPNAVQTLSVSASPQILLVDLSDSQDPLGEINALAEVCEPGTIVIAIGGVNDVHLYRELLASGIHDYLLKPVSDHVMREALHNAQAILLAPKNTPAAEAEPESKTSTVAVIGARGGVGASTVATSLAWATSHALGRKTALLDFDLHFGVGALSFDLEPGRGLTDALENPARIDSLFIERAIVKASENLAILSAE